MDTQIKLIFEISNSINNNTIYEPKIQVVDIKDEIYTDGFLGDKVVEFDEYKLVRVTFESSDPTSILEIESFLCENMLIVKPGERVDITSGGNQENMLVPGYYALQIRTTNRIYSGLFKVNSSSISFQGLESIREHLESIVEGLAYNLYINRVGSEIKVPQKNIFLEDVYRKLYDNQKGIINNLNSIVESPITDIEKVYKEQRSSKRSDMKSQKWLYKKGASLNSNIYSPYITYEKHSCLTRNIPENRWIKKIIVYIGDLLRELKISYGQIYDEILEKIDNKKKQLEYREKEYNKVNYTKFVSENVVRKVYSQIKFLKSDILELSSQLQHTDNVIKNIDSIKGMLSYYEHETWLKEIKEYEKANKPTLRLLKDNRYSSLYNFYRNVTMMKKDNHKNNKTSFAYKNTAKLFEYYIYCLMIDIFEKVGFNWEKGWLADKTSQCLTNGDLEPETKIVLVNEGYYCELVYDMEIESEPKDIAVSQFVAINSRHRRPDIRISIFKDNGQILGSAIIEVKCRKAKYIYNENGDTQVIEQLKDYYNFAYYDSKRKEPLKNIIDKIIVIYPKQENIIEYNNFFYPFSFMQIEANKQGEQPFGYEEIKAELENFILKSIGRDRN